jgi:hypothetical protein
MFSRHRVRALAVGALLAALAVPLAVWASGAFSSSSSFVTFRNDFVSFRYPAAWGASVWKEQTPHFQPMVYVSTQATHDPCRTSGSTVACAWPVTKLAPGGVLVKWENKGFPGASAARFPGALTQIGGRTARVSLARPGTCRSVGADETMTVSIERPLADNWTEVSACLRGPNLRAREDQVRALLSSTRFLTP